MTMFKGRKRIFTEEPGGGATQSHGIEPRDPLSGASRPMVGAMNYIMAPDKMA